MNTLVKTKEPRLPARTKFNSLVIKEQLNVTSGIIDGVNVTSIFQQRVPLRGNSTIKSNIVFRNAVTAGKISAFFLPTSSCNKKNNRIADNINVKNINDLTMSDVVLRTMAPGQVITGKKNLNGTMNIEVIIFESIKRRSV